MLDQRHEPYAAQLDAATEPTQLAGEADPGDGLVALADEVDGALVALDDDAAGDVEAEAGALADVLGRVERVERAGGDLGGRGPAPVSAISTTTASSSARVVTRSVPAPVHGVDGVVDAGWSTPG